MSTSNFLAVFIGSQHSAQMTAWNAMPEADRQARMQKGMAAWHGWVETHKSSIVDMGGPLGKTLKVDAQGLHEIRNMLRGYTLVRAASHETAAKMFENHPHFSIFPGESVEIMPVMPIPGGT